tara:strand:+ start:447 stop:680 length:234 start_codon:yes stop_codon:yes gene_type:complete
MSAVSSLEINNINNNNNNNKKFLNKSPNPWPEYALFGSWTEEDLYETYKFAFYDRSINIKELISLYMTWKLYCNKKK